MAHETRLRKVGGSVMMSVPPAVLDELGLGPDSTVGLRVSKGRILVEPRSRPRYTLDALLKETSRVKSGRKDREWLSSRPKGREIL